MKYDWERIISEQKDSVLSIITYCVQNKLPKSSFYKAMKKLNNDQEDEVSFTSVEIVNHSMVSLSIDGHQLMFEASLLPDVTFSFIVTLGFLSIEKSHLHRYTFVFLCLLYWDHIRILTFLIHYITLFLLFIKKLFHIYKNIL